jgi:hypothetical protein
MKPPEEVAREIVNSLFVEAPTAREWDIVEALIPAITAAIEAERKRFDDAQKFAVDTLKIMDESNRSNSSGWHNAECKAETLRQRLKDAEKWMRHLDGCAFGSRIAYNSMTKSFCTCGLTEFKKGKVRG